MSAHPVASAFLPGALVGAALFALHAARNGASPDPARANGSLLRGARVESVIAHDETQRYPLALDAGRYLQLEVMQYGVDAVLRLFAPDGSLLVESDGVNGLEGPESVSLVSDHAGTYALEVHAIEVGAGGDPGRITLRVTEHGEASARNRARVAADARAALGRRLYLEREPDSVERARVELALAAREFRDASDVPGEADSLYVLGAAASSRERFGEALEPLTRALELARALEDPRREADALWLRGWAYSYLGEWRHAIDDLTVAVPLFQQLGDAAREVRSLCRLVGPYAQMGDPARALEYATLALRVARPLGESRELCEALNVLGTAHLWLGDSEAGQALFEEALEISRRRGYRDLQRANLGSLGAALRRQGRNEEARAPLLESIDLAREGRSLQSEAELLLQLSGTYQPASDPTRRELLERSLELSRAIGYHWGEAATLTNLASGSLAAGELERARRLVEEAVAARERQWRRVPTAGLRSAFLAEQFPTFELYVDVLMASHRAGVDAGAAALAFSAADGARARALRQELARARVEVAGEVPHEIQERRRDLGRQLVALEAAARRSHATDAPTDLGAARSVIDALEAELRRVEARIAHASPRWAALMLPDPVPLDEVQRELLDPDTVLLEYALGTRRSHLFVVSSERLDVFDLPARAVVETAAREVIEAVTARNRRVRFESAAERERRLAAADSGFDRAAAELSASVLGPAAAAIAGKRLALVTDGALQYVPFAALPSPRAPAASSDAGESSAEAPITLGVAHEIVHLPSASTLREIRRQERLAAPSTATLAVVADPVLRADDRRFGLVPRVGSLLLSLTRGNDRHANAAGAEAESLAWPDLRYAREEAEAILALVPPQESTALLGFDAGRAVVAGPMLSGHRYFHFATHALVDDTRPELSGIVLSTFDERGRPQEGLLSLLDIYELRLQSDLVVLSGCRTALGKEIRGEGLVGLARGFMFAGAPRVVVSLWDVDDRATAELMKRFYAGLLLEDQAPAAALRAAQAALARDPAWGSPYYWAGFVLQGDWRQPRPKLSR